jgi:hypothetical protein
MTPNVVTAGLADTLTPGDPRRGFAKSLVTDAMVEAACDAAAPHWYTFDVDRRERMRAKYRRAIEAAVALLVEVLP